MIAASLYGCEDAECAWRPAEKLAMALRMSFPAALDLIGSLMLMSPEAGEELPTTHGGTVRAWCYKHSTTRRSVYLDREAHAWLYRSGTLVPFATPTAALAWWLR